MRQKRLRDEISSGGESSKHVNADTRAVNTEERDEERQDIQGWQSHEEDKESSAELWRVGQADQGEAAQVDQDEEDQHGGA